MKTFAFYALTVCLGLIFAVLKLQYGTLDSTLQALLVIAIALPGALALARTLEYSLIDVALGRHSAHETSELHRLVLRLSVYAAAALLVLRYCTTNVLANKTVGSDVLERLWYALDRADIPMTFLPGSVAPLQTDGSVGETASYEAAPEMIRRVESAAHAGASPDRLAMGLGGKPRRPPGFERELRLLEGAPLFAGLDEESL